MVDAATIDALRLLRRMRASSPDVAKRLALPEGSLPSQALEDVHAATLRAAELARLDGARFVGDERVRRVLADMAPRWLSDAANVERVFGADDTADEWNVRRRLVERRNAREVRTLAERLVEAAKSGSYEATLEALEAVRSHRPDATMPGSRPWVYSPRELARMTREHLAAMATRPRISAGLLGPVLASSPPGSLVVVGGDTNTGKSGLMLYASERFDAAGQKVAIVSLEDPAFVWGDRFQVSRSGVSMISAARRGGLTAEELEDVERGIDALASSSVRVSILPTSKLPAVVDEVRALATEGAEIVFVDYVQEITTDQEAEDRRLQVTRAARELKAIAKELGIVLVLGSQLSRSAGRVRGNEPTSQSLKESGDLENMAEIVIVLWRESDEPNAPTLGKVAKDKVSGERSRFRLVRENSGAIVDVAPPLASSEFSDEPAGGDATRSGGRWGGRR